MRPHVCDEACGIFYERFCPMWRRLNHLPSPEQVAQRKAEAAAKAIEDAKKPKPIPPVPAWMEWFPEE